MRSLREWAPGPGQKERQSGWWRGGRAGRHPLARRHRAHRLGSGGFEEENRLDAVTLSEAVTRFEENVRFRKSHSGPRSLPSGALRGPREKRLPPREKWPPLRAVVRRRGARWPPRCRRPGLSGPRWGPVGGCGAASGGSRCRGGQSAKAGSRHGEGVISGQEAEAGSRWGGGGATQLPGEGGGSAPGGHGAQPAAALTPACAPPESARPRPEVCTHGPAPPSPAPLGPFSAGTPPPKLRKKFPNFSQAGRGAPAPGLHLPALPLAPHLSSRAAAGPEPSPALPCPPARRPDTDPRLVRRASRPVTCGCNRARLPSPRRWQLLASAPPALLPGAELCQGSAPASPTRQLSPSSPLQPMCGQSRPGLLTPP